MMGILFAEYALSHRNAPVDAQRRVIPGNGSLALRSIIVVTLILEDRLIAQHGESVRKSTGDKQHTVVLFRQFHCHMLSEGGTTPADIHSHIEDCTTYHPHQLGLSERRLLEMQATHHTGHTPAFVVLNEMGSAHILFKFILTERLKKIASCIAEYTWFQYHGTFYRCANIVHFCNIFAKLQNNYEL